MRHSVPMTGESEGIPEYTQAWCVLCCPLAWVIQEEFAISLPRPRGINGAELNAETARITDALKNYIPGEPQ